MPLFMILLIPYLNLLNLFWINISIFEEYGAVNCCDLFVIIKTLQVIKGKGYTFKGSNSVNIVCSLQKRGLL